MSHDVIEVDVLVVGTGASGMSTAVTAAHHGLHVLVVEKEPLFGAQLHALAVGYGYLVRI